jgi:hypothetical protein
MKPHAPTSRHLISLATNPACQRLRRKLLLGLSNQDACRLLAHTELPGGHRERTAALRHGRLFHRHLAANRGAALLASTREIAPIDTSTVRVLDVEDASRKYTGYPLKHAVLMTEKALCNAARQRPRVIGMSVPPLDN